MPQFGRSFVVGVMGGSSCTDAQFGVAERVGRVIAQAGAVLLCGGGTGVMEASAKGAREAAGLTVGILPGSSAEAANPYISLAIPTNLGDARNPVNILSSDLIVAIGGAGGTLSEIALALKNGKRVLGYDTCIPHFSNNAQPLGFTSFQSVEALLDALKEAIPPCR